MSESPAARKRRIIRRVAWIGTVVAIAAMGIWLLTPKPLPVDVSRAETGPMEVTVDEEGEVRVHDRYVIAAPAAGKLLRVDLDDGDAVRGEPARGAVDHLQGLDPHFLVLRGCDVNHVEGFVFRPVQVAEGIGADNGRPFLQARDL